MQKAEKQCENFRSKCQRVENQLQVLRIHHHEMKERLSKSESGVVTAEECVTKLTKLNAQHDLERKKERESGKKVCMCVCVCVCADCVCVWCVFICVCLYDECYWGLLLLYIVIDY